MTKPIISAATLRLVEADRLRLDDPVERWLPELADRRVLRSPASRLDDVERAHRPIQVDDLLVNGSGYGVDITGQTPIGQAMHTAGVDAGPEPVTIGAQDWLDRLAALPLTHQPGQGFRYHHSFPLLGILISRLTGRALQDHLAEDLCRPIGMTDTCSWLRPEKAARLPPAYRLESGRLVETEPAGGGGLWVGDPGLDVSHNELLSSAADLHRFARVLLDGGRLPDGTAWLSPHTVAAMTSDQVPAEVKTPESFFPGFWTDVGWGHGLCVETGGPHQGRYGWSGGQGTDFFVDPATRTIVIVLAQVDLGPELWRVIEDVHRSV